MLNNISPSCINSLFLPKQYSYNTRNKRLPYISDHKTSLYNKSFLAKSILKFSYLSEDIKNSQSIHTFKKKYKNYLINKY